MVNASAVHLAVVESPGVLACAIQRQRRCPPAHGTRAGGRTGNASNRSPETFEKNRTTGTACGKPLPLRGLVSGPALVTMPVPPPSQQSHRPAALTWAAF